MLVKNLNVDTERNLGLNITRLLDSLSIEERREALECA